MDRKKFLTASGVLAAASILPTNSLLAQQDDENGLDKLTDVADRLSTAIKLK